MFIWWDFHCFHLFLIVLALLLHSFAYTNILGNSRLASYILSSFECEIVAKYWNTEQQWWG